MSLYNGNGQIKTTSVSGSSYTGLYAADGSYNIVTNTSTSYVGLFHPCGALNAVVATNPTGYYATNGSVNVISSGGGNVLAFPMGMVSTTNTTILLDNFSRYANNTVMNGQVPVTGPAWATTGD